MSRWPGPGACALPAEDEERSDGHECLDHDWTASLNGEDDENEVGRHGHGPHEQARGRGPRHATWRDGQEQHHGRQPGTDDVGLDDTRAFVGEHPRHDRESNDCIKQI